MIWPLKAVLRHAHLANMYMTVRIHCEVVASLFERLRKM